MTRIDFEKQIIGLIEKYEQVNYEIVGCGITYYNEELEYNGEQFDSITKLGYRWTKELSGDEPDPVPDGFFVPYEEDEI